MKTVPDILTAYSDVTLQHGTPGATINAHDPIITTCVPNPNANEATIDPNPLECDIPIGSRGKSTKNTNVVDVDNLQDIDTTEIYMGMKLIMLTQKANHK